MVPCPLCTICYTTAVFQFVTIFLAGHFRRVLDGLLRWVRLVDNDTVFAGNRSLVHGARSSIQRRDGSGNTVFAGQPSPSGVDGADAVVRLEHRRASGSHRKRRQIIIYDDKLLYSIYAIL